MKTKLFLLLLFVFVASCTTKTTNDLTDQEESTLRQAIENDTLFASWVEDTSNAIKIYKQYKVNVMRSDSLWESDQQRLKKIDDFGYTSKFELIPLVENLYGDTTFRKAEGVSYLIQTDNSTILFDTGIDDDSTMCILRYNLDKLGIDISKIDAVFISHNHGDHQNNWKWINDKTFVTTENENILQSIKIYVPRNDLNLKIPTVFSNDPVKLSEGVYTTGIIRAPMFFSFSQEQGLMINVKDKGIVIISGCGHQTVEKILLRCEKISNIPIYGLLGGLHFPVDGDSEKYMGYYITGKLPWVPFTLNDVNKKIGLIKKRNLKLVGLSTHDSSPTAVEAFKTTFSKEYQDLRVGEWIVLE